MAWGSEINAWTERLVKAWNTGDMPEFRRLAKKADAVFSEEALQEHGVALFNELGMAATAGIEASFQVLAQIDLGFGPSDTAGLEFVQGRKVVEAMMNSAGWRDVPYLLRDRAFFSAYVADMQTLSEMKARISLALGWKPGDDDGPVMDAGRFEKEMRRILINGDVRTAAPEELGTVRDIMSTPRLQLIFRTQKDMARGWSEMKTGMDPDLLDAVPGYEFVRITPRRNPRPDAFWDGRWRQACSMAGGKGCIVSPKVALKTSPVWQMLGNLGPFGNPFDPFDYGTGMGREELDRAFCEAVGLIGAEERVAPVKVPDLNERLDAGVSGLDAESLDRLQARFGRQITIDGDRAVWKA